MAVLRRYCFHILFFCWLPESVLQLLGRHVEDQAALGLERILDGADLVVVRQRLSQRALVPRRLLLRLLTPDRCWAAD